MRKFTEFSCTEHSQLELVSSLARCFVQAQQVGKTCPHTRFLEAVVRSGVSPFLIPGILLFCRMITFNFQICILVT